MPANTKTANTNRTGSKPTARADSRATNGAAAPKSATKTLRRPSFRRNLHVVYPAHGVGKILKIERQTIGGVEIPVLVIYFEKEKMTLRVPSASAAESGLRNLSSQTEIGEALRTLRGRARIRRMMWSRRAQEYEQKINSGSLISIAEVVRDLHRADDQGQSYSERQLYEQARDRLTREIATVQKSEDSAAVARIDEALLNKAV